MGASACVVVSSSLEVGVTVTGAGELGEGLSASATGGVQVSSADHISQLGGPFVTTGATGGCGPAVSVQGFQGQNGVVGVDLGAGAGCGASWNAGVTGTAIPWSTEGRPATSPQSSGAIDRWYLEPSVGNPRMPVDPVSNSK